MIEAGVVWGPQTVLNHGIAVAENARERGMEDVTGLPGKRPHTTLYLKNNIDKYIFLLKFLLC